MNTSLFSHINTSISGFFSVKNSALFDWVFTYFSNIKNISAAYIDAGVSI